MATFTVDQRVRIVTCTTMIGHRVGTVGTVVKVDADADLRLVDANKIWIWHRAGDLELVEETPQRPDLPYLVEASHPDGIPCGPGCEAGRKLEALRGRLRDIIGVSSPCEDITINCGELRDLLEGDQS